MAAPRTWLAAVSVLSAALLAACDGEPPKQDTSTTSAAPPSTASSGTGQADEAPPVRRPLNDGALVAAPCSSLTEVQLADLRLGGGYDEHAPGPGGGPSNCSFADLDPNTDLVVYLFYFDDGLGDLYDLNAGSMWTDWTPFQMDGYPAVRFRDYKAANVCDLGVGTSDTTYFRVQVLDPDVDAKRDTCELVSDVGAAVLATVQAAN
jgi:hypothetical protein